MNTFFLFLRAINVGGHNMIKMAKLTLWLQELGFVNIKTYLQSGNVIFQTSNNDTEVMAKQIREKILLESQLNIASIIRKHSEIKSINVILDKHEADKPENSSVFLTLLSALPSKENIEKLKKIDSGLDTFILYGKDIILVCQQPYHKTKLSNNLFERLLKVDATSRNRNTIEKLVAMSPPIS